MVNINLLPWREAESQYQKSMLKKMLMLVIMLAVIINMVLHMVFVQKENNIQDRIGSINEEIKNLNHGVMQQPSKRNEHFWKEMFSETSHMTGTCFSGIEESDKTITFAGKARSVSDLTMFLKHWQVAAFFSDIKIRLIEEDGKGMVKFVVEGRK